MKRILCIWLPNWPIQRLIAAQPEHKQRALILHVSHARLGRCVAACSRTAWLRGVRPGMPLAEALAFEANGKPIAAGAGRSSRPHSHHTDSSLSPYVAAHDPQADWKHLQELARYCERFSPLVGFERQELTPSEGASERAMERAMGRGHPSCLYLDVSRLGSHFGGEHHLARQVAESFDRQGYQVQAAIADTFGAAWAAAHYARQQSTLVSRSTEQSGSSQTTGSAAGQPSPRSCFLVIDSAETSTSLNALPIESLRLPSHVVRSLQQLGVLTVRQLAQLPRASLPSRFGNEILRRWDQATGLVEEVMVTHQAPLVFQADTAIEYPTDRQAAIHHILHPLTQHVTQSLIAAGRGVLELVCTLRCQTVDNSGNVQSTRSCPQSFQLRLSQPTVSTSHILDLLHMQLDRQALQGLVEHVTLQASITTRLEHHQGQLFSDQAVSTESHIVQLIDRLSTRLGSKAVGRPQLRADFQPEYGFFYQQMPAGSSSRSVHGQPLANSEYPRRCSRPLFLTSPPLPLNVIALAHAGPPVQLQLNHRPCRVIRHWGPERIETGWWRNHTIRRDYYRIETERGQHLWVFRELDNGKWFVHGTFA